MTVKHPKPTAVAKPISLAPLSFEQAVDALIRKPAVAKASQKEQSTEAPKPPAKQRRGK